MFPMKKDIYILEIKLMTYLLILNYAKDNYGYDTKI